MYSATLFVADADRVTAGVEHRAVRGFQHERRGGGPGVAAGAAVREEALLSRDVEDDALRERQLARVVDGGGLAAHVRLPRVGAGLAAAAGLLLAAERAADLGAARADVDVRDPAVGAGRCEEALGLAQVGREDRRGKPLRYAVLQRDRLVRLGVGEHVEDRRERLLLDDRGLRGHPHDRRAPRTRRPASASASARLAADDDLAARRRACASAASMRPNDSPVTSGPTSVPVSRGSPIGTLR